jgi:hypothetical protein
VALEGIGHVDLVVRVGELEARLAGLEGSSTSEEAD